MNKEHTARAGQVTSANALSRRYGINVDGLKEWFTEYQDTGSVACIEGENVWRQSLMVFQLV